MEVAENKAQIEANALSALKKYVKNYKIFIDTCSLLYEHSDEFMQRLVPILKSNGAKLYVAVKVVAELQKHSKNKENAEKLCDELHNAQAFQCDISSFSSSIFKKRI